MRGRASGLGARISSMVLVILSVSTEVHWSDNLLDERNLTGGQTVLGVEVLVCPSLRPRLRWYKRVNLACCALGWLMQKNQESRQPTEEVGQRALCLPPGVERAYADISLRRNGARLP